MPQEFEIDPLLGIKIAEYEEACPYLEDHNSILPLYLPMGPVDGPTFDQALERGARRTGPYLYVTNCPSCQACESIRLEIAKFSSRRRHKRVIKKCSDRVTVEIGTPIADQQRVDLYNRHKVQRDLGSSLVDLEEYEGFLVSSCCQTLEFRYLVEGKLIGIAIADLGKESLSAVYCYFDPDYSDLNIGTYSVLKHIEYCRNYDIRFLYLGFYIADCSHMNYKANYLPHQRLIDGQWITFER